MILLTKIEPGSYFIHWLIMAISMMLIADAKKEHEKDSNDTNLW